MNRDVEFLCELWELLTPFLSKHDKPEAALALIELLDNYGMSDGFEECVEVAPVIKKAIDNYYNGDSSEDEDE